MTMALSGTENIIDSFFSSMLMIFVVILLIGLLLCVGVTVFAQRLVNKHIREEEEDENGADTK